LLALLGRMASAVMGVVKQIFSQTGGDHGLSTPGKGGGDGPVADCTVRSTP
jgi:hypothetical protein